MYIGGGFDEVLSKLQPYEFCSDKVEAITTFMENPNYKSGNGEVWGYNTYNGNKVFAGPTEAKGPPPLIPVVPVPETAVKV